MKSRTYSFTREKVVAEAERRGWHVRYFGPDDYFYEISTPDSRSCIFRGSMPQTSAWIGGHISEHKLLSLEYLRHLGLMPPPFAIYTNDQDAEQFLRQYSPIVVKPEDSERSQGVTVNVTDMARLHEAVAIAREFSDQVILQQQLEGKLYRLLAIGGKFCAAFARLPAFVLGDGLRTVQALIVEKNTHPLRGSESTSPLKPIQLESAREYLAAHNQNLNDVPADGEMVVLSAIPHVSFGGEAADVTDLVHQSYIKVVEQVAEKLQIVSCGFDLITPDIAQPHPTAIFPVLEFNALPGFRMHYYPTAGGEARNVAATLLDTVFGSLA